MAKTPKNFSGFSDFERDAMRQRAQELRAEAKAKNKRVAGEATIKSAIAEMPEPDKSLAKKVHEIVTKTAPKLLPKTWYGMPAYTNSDDKVICFFQSGHKYKARYCTFGVQDSAKLDDGNMWATSFALIKIGPAEEKKIVELIKKAGR